MALKYEYMGVLRVVLFQDGVEKCKKKKNWCHKRNSIYAQLLIEKEKGNQPNMLVKRTTKTTHHSTQSFAFYEICHTRK